MGDVPAEAGGCGVSEDGVALAQLIEALRPWHEKIVFVGGWAHRLHRFHPDATVPSYQPIVTKDADRRRTKKAQDILYLNDTLELFGERLDTLRTCWVDDVQPALSAAQRKAVAVAIVSIFGAVSDAVREAARIPQGRAISPAEIQLRCSAGLLDLFG